MDIFGEQGDYCLSFGSRCVGGSSHVWYKDRTPELISYLLATFIDTQYI